MTHLRIKNTGGPRRGEIWVAKNLPYDDGIRNKTRPVLVIRLEGNTAICCRCTTKISVSKDRYKVMDPISANLLKDSYIRYKTETIPLNKMSRRLGILSKADMEGFGMTQKSTPANAGNLSICQTLILTADLSLNGLPDHLEGRVVSSHLNFHR